MDADPRSPRFALHRSVFWRLAGVLVGAQVATGFVAVALATFFAQDRSYDFVARSLRLQLDRAAGEVEQRTALDEGGLGDLPRSLRLDLAQRFPDPLYLLDAGGRVVDRIGPGSVGADAPALRVTPPAEVRAALARGEVDVRLDRRRGANSWGAAPLFDVDGILAGGLLVMPLTRSIEAELQASRAGFRRALVITMLMAFLTALLLGALLTWQLVRPLRRMTRRVESIGAGDYAGRLPDARRDELGRLASAINHMAAEVEKSVEALQATDRLRRELLQNVGHDLRTPLAALMGYLEEADRFLFEGRTDAALEALETARRQAVYLQRLITDLFELSQLLSGPPPLRPEPVPVAELLHEAARAHRGRFREAGIGFHLALPPSLPVIQADGVRLLRVLDNLLANAARHTPTGGEVRLEAEAREDAVEIRVRDTGVGMSGPVLERVFERYYRGDDARTRDDGGTGLGLSISRATARAHGGELSAVSAPGRGSTFILRLPREAVGNREPGIGRGDA